MKRRDFPALTGLRFFLALWVILQHLTGPGQKLEATALVLPHGLFTLIRGGYQAVTTFFVLSGSRTYAELCGDSAWSRRNTLRYALGRVARVYPVYLLSLAVVAPFILADQTAGKPGYVAAHLLLVQAWLGAIPVNWNTRRGRFRARCFSMQCALAALFNPVAFWRGIALVAAVAFCLTRFMWAAGVSDNIKPLVHLSDFLMGIAAACAYELLQRRSRPPRGWWLYIPISRGAVGASAGTWKPCRTSST